MAQLGTERYSDKSRAGMTQSYFLWSVFILPADILSELLLESCRWQAELY